MVLLLDTGTNKIKGLRTEAWWLRWQRVRLETERSQVLISLDPMRPASERNPQLRLRRDNK